MPPLPTKELLEAAHSFPGPYTIKAIGLAENDFVARVVAAVQEVLGHELDLPHTTRETAGGRHVSVTLEPTLQSAEQVLAVYSRIQQEKGLVMLF